MPITRIFLLFTLVSLSLASVAQTKLLHHRSHSGSLANFAADAPGNFGLPIDIEVKQVIWLSDSVVVEVAQFGAQELRDTFLHHPIYHNPTITLDSMKQLLHPEVEFIDIDKRSGTPAESHRIQPMQGQQSPQKNQQASMLLLALIIGFFGGWYWWIANRRLEKTAV